MVGFLWIIAPKNITRIASASRLTATSSNIQGGSAQEQQVLQRKNYYSTVQFKLQGYASYDATSIIFIWESSWNGMNIFD